MRVAICSKEGFEAFILILSIIWPSSGSFWEWNHEESSRFWTNSIRINFS